MADALPPNDEIITDASLNKVVGGFPKPLPDGSACPMHTGATTPHLTEDEGSTCYGYGWMSNW